MNLAIVSKTVKFLVIEVFEREIHSVTPCENKSQAIRKANELLRARVRECNNEEESEYVIDATIRELIQDGEAARAGAGSMEAWCNLGHDNWDAHIIDVDDIFNGNL